MLLRELLTQNRRSSIGHDHGHILVAKEAKALKIDSELH